MNYYVAGECTVTHFDGMPVFIGMMIRAGILIMKLVLSVRRPVEVAGHDTGCHNIFGILLCWFRRQLEQVMHGLIF